MKKITIALLALGLLPVLSMAQEEKNEVIIEKEINGAKKEKKETQEIVIRKNGDKDIKLKVEIDGDNITVNGKPLSEFKDKDISINKRKMTITDGNNVMSWNFGQDGEDWEKWGESFGENFGRNFKGDWEINEEDGHDGAFLGVTTENDKDGAKITNVLKGSAAEKAGLATGDIITKVGEEKIAGPEALSDVIGFKKPADEVKVTYKRNGKTKTVNATLGKRKNTKSLSFGGRSPRVFSFKSPGMPMSPLAPNMEGLHENLSELQENALLHSLGGRKKIGLKIQDTEEGNGVKVMGVEDSSAAAIAGLKKDDIIIEINAQKVTNTDEARAELFSDEDSRGYKIKALRGGKEMNFEVKIPKKLKTANL